MASPLSSSSTVAINDLFLMNVPRDITAVALEAFVSKQAPGLGRFMVAVNHGGKAGTNTTYAFLAYEDPAKGLIAIPLLDGARLDDAVNDARPLHCKLNLEPTSPHTFMARRGPHWGIGSRFYLPECPRPNRIVEAEAANDLLREQLTRQAKEFAKLKLQRDELLQVVGSVSADQACSNCKRLQLEGDQLLLDYYAMRESRDSLQCKGEELHAEYEKLQHQIAVPNESRVIAVQVPKRESATAAAVERLRLENIRLRSQADERDRQLEFALSPFHAFRPRLVRTHTHTLKPTNKHTYI